MKEDERRARVLRRLDDGELTVDQALAALEQPDQETVGESGVTVVNRSIPEDFAHQQRVLSSWRNWWLIPLTVGLVLSGTGIWLAQYGGWWWLAAAPALLAGAPVTLLSLASANSPWVHIRIRDFERGSQKAAAGWPKTFGISLPIPVRPAAWLLRTFGPMIPQLDRTAIDELLLALEGSRAEGAPLHVEVDAGPDGERIEVYIG